MPQNTDTFREILANTTATIPTLKWEVEKAEARLALTQEKIAHLQALIDLYEAEEGMAVSSDVPTVPLPPRPKNKSPRPKRSSKKDEMAENIRFMLFHESPMHRTRILEILTTQGVMGNEKNPMGQLAAFLSYHRHEFVSDSRGNFSLRKNGHTEPTPAHIDDEVGNAGVDDAAGAAPPVADYHGERSVVS